MTVYKRPVPYEVYEICGNQREHHRLGQVHALEITAKYKVKQKRKCAPVQCAQIWNRLIQHRCLNIERAEYGLEQPHDSHQKRRDCEAQVYPIHKRVVTILYIAGSIRV